MPDRHKVKLAVRFDPPLAGVMISREFEYALTPAECRRLYAALMNPEAVIAAKGGEDG